MGKWIYGIPCTQLESKEGVEVKLKELTFFLVYDGEVLSLALQVLLGRALRMHWIRGSMDPGAPLNVLANSKFLYGSYQELKYCCGISHIFFVTSITTPQKFQIQSLQ